MQNSVIPPPKMPDGNPLQHTRDPYAVLALLWPHTNVTPLLNEVGIYRTRI